MTQPLKRDVLRKPVEVSAAEIRALSKRAQQHMVNASLIAIHGKRFAADELQEAIDMLTRLQSRIAAQSAIEVARDFREFK